MAKRPPQRPANRNTAQAGVLDAGALRAADTAQGQGTDDATTPPAPPPPAGIAPRLAGNRDEFLQMLGELRDQGSVSVADEAAIVREYDGLVVQLRTEKGRLEAEYRQRLDRDGREATDTWLAEAAEALGRRHGEHMRQLFKTIPALAQGQATE